MIGTPRVHHRLTDSTNERAKELAARGRAPRHARDRGRAERGPRAPGPRVDGAAAAARADVAGAARLDATLLPLAAAVAVCEARARVECAIKWPNDVWIDGRKLAGILVEGRPQEGWAVLGIGLNVTRPEFPPSWPTRATSLARAGAAVEPVLRTLLDDSSVGWATSPRRCSPRWRERDALLGQTVRWDGGAGTAAGVDDTGALLVRHRARPVALHAGEVHLRR